MFRMTTERACALPGCSKPAYPSSPSRDERHLACGNLHHQLLMAIRFNPSFSHYNTDILERNASGFCALAPCKSKPSPGHSWCSRSHYLDWLSNFTSNLEPEQNCKLAKCTRHVFVDENSTRSEFCGFRHQQKYIMSVAMRNRVQISPRRQSPASVVSATEEEINTERHIVHTKALQVKGNRTFSGELAVDVLSKYVSSGMVPENISVHEDFFQIHPWEVCTEGRKLMIVRFQLTSKGKRVLTTKDGYRWRQYGPPIDKGTYTLKYFRYTASKANTHDSSMPEYKMDEYSVDTVKDFSVIKLTKHTKSRRAAACNIEDACPTSNMIQLSDQVSINDSRNSLPPISSSFDDLDFDWFKQNETHNGPFEI
ncbi:hypothetical protein KP509_18G042900 [Ceratopteris richardii]|uniref:Uncharacterized protein n=1 Tax=Ceratopteris richardii TaxID=49495 RepID=A0A8T2SSV7_CERRI|nr:hypothetical protein KP509_18G042900 [Ceratopteris richardii]